ncbi:MAG: MerR family transcriptional regulator [Eubacteriales bacterium]
MDLIKITELTNQLDISSRSLRYYEQIGLIRSVRREFEKYRYFDMENVEKLKQIIVLRKMQISIKDIIRIYESQDMSVVVETFVDRINAIDEEVNALFEMKRITNEFLQTMIKNGIKKISALPLLYEEMDKQFEVMDDRKQVTYEELSAADEKLAKPIESAIISLGAMRVLSSRLKANPQVSDPDGFWLWLQKSDITPGLPGRHDQFEFQTAESDVVLLKISDDFINNSAYLDFIFEGGLFAALNIYLDEDISARLRVLINSFNINKYYEIDYLHNGQLRHEVMIESLISPDENRELIAFYVPVKKRTADSVHFEQGKNLNNITIEELEKQNPILWEKEVDIMSLTPRENSKLTLLENGEVDFLQWLWPGVLPTEIYVKIPFCVDIEFRTGLSSLYITHGKGMMKINGGYRNDHSHHRHSLTLRQPVFGDDYTIDHIGITNPEKINKASWIVGEKYIACILNGEVKICFTDTPYMNLEAKNHTPFAITIGSDQDHYHHDLTLKNIKIVQLAQTKKVLLKKGDLIMITKQSNNILPDLHQLVTWHFGQNYVFDGCMAFLMEHIKPGEPIIADFEFFGAIDSDTIVQTYGHGFNRPFNCHDLPLSSFWDGADFCGYVFNEIGYEHTYVTHKQLNANKRMYTDTLMAYIDKGIPVLQRWVPCNAYEPSRGGFDPSSGGYSSGLGSCYTVIVGYEENGKTLLYLDGDNAEPEKYSTDGQIMWDWIFIGDKKRKIDKEQLYRNCLKRAYEMLTTPDNYGASYGAKAFRDWADDIENGWFANGGEYTTYVCVMATNGRAFGHIIKEMPCFTFINDILVHCNKVGNIWNELESLGGGFNVTNEIMQDKDKRKQIADKVREFALEMDEIVRILKENN